MPRESDTHKKYNLTHASRIFDSIDSQINIFPSPQRLIKSTLDLQVHAINCIKPNKRNYNEFLIDHQEKPCKSNNNKTYIDLTAIDDDDDDNDEHSFENEKARKEYHSALNQLDFPIDKLFRKTLKTHQLQGLSFMWDHVYKKRHGCLLSHTMGLGKTLQTIALLTTLYQHIKLHPEANFPASKRVLIIVPLITVINWADEFNKWATDDFDQVLGEVYNFSEIQQKKQRIRFLQHWYSQGGVMLISYDQYRILLNSPKNPNHQQSWKFLVNPGPDIVILDEAHRIKNAHTATTSLISRIRTKMRVCLTGYPLQNHLLEYYYMADFILPGVLGGMAEFKKTFTGPIENCFEDSPATTRKEAALKLYTLQLLTERLAHRRDNDILEKELPLKTEYIVRFKLNPIQLEGYNRILESLQETGPLIGLMILRALCNHPQILCEFMKRSQERKRNAQLDKGENGNTISRVIAESDITIEIAPEPDIKIEENLDAFDAELSEDNEEAVIAEVLPAHKTWFMDYFENPEIESWKCSGKMSFIVDLVRACQAVKDKVVIASHSLACLDYIQHLLLVFGVKMCRLDGSQLSFERAEAIDRFNKSMEIDVMLISVKAASIGINLIAANRIILVDMDWNPMYDEQSIGRLYRLGQRKPVFVYRLMAYSTIEEKIFNLHVHKKSLARRIIDNKFTSTVSKEELGAYYIRPKTIIEPINLKTLDSITKKDFISYSALEQNRTFITHFETYKQKIENEEFVSISSLTKAEKRLAKEEALKILKQASIKRRYFL